MTASKTANVINIISRIPFVIVCSFKMPYNVEAASLAVAASTELRTGAKPAKSYCRVCGVDAAIARNRPLCVRRFRVKHCYSLIENSHDSTSISYFTLSFVPLYLSTCKSNSRTPFSYFL